MKKIITNFHDVSDYIKLNSKKTYKECAVVLMCTFLLCTLGAMTDSNNAYEVQSNKKDVLQVTSEVKKNMVEHRPANIQYNELPKTTEQIKEEQMLSLELSVEVKDSDQENTEIKTEEMMSASATQETMEEEMSEAVSKKGEVADITKSDLASMDSLAGELTVSQNVPEETTISDNTIIESEVSENSVIVNIPMELTSGDGTTVENTVSAAEVSEVAASELTDISVSENVADVTAAPAQGIVSASAYDALCRIVEAEAGSEGEEGKLLVANVVLNRVASPQFPNSVEEVVLQSANGKVQFSPVANGSYASAVATPETINAVNRALSGENNSMGALFFKSVRSDSNWNNRTFLFNYGNHNFYI